MRTRWKAAFAAGSMLAGLTSVGSVYATTPAPPDGDVGTIVIGSANFAESELLGQIYGQALAAAGFDVAYLPAIGTREVYLGAIENGEIQIVPEYTNSLLSELLKPERSTAANLNEQLIALGEVLPDGLEVLTPSVAEDKDTIVCTQAVVDEYGLTNLTDLAGSSAEIRLGAPPEFEDRSPFGLLGFSEILGAEFAEFVPLAYGDIPAALAGDAIDCGNIFSTSSAIVENDLVALEDDQGLVPAENVLPLIRTDVATPEVVAVLDDVSSRLDTETLKRLVAQVEVDARGADVVAEEWLASNPRTVNRSTDGTLAVAASTVPD